MIGQRVQQLRLARHLSLEALAAKMGGIVTKQALSKYEHNRANPSPIVLTRLANSLNVRAAYFLAEPKIRVEYIAYRSAGVLGERESKQLKSQVQHNLESRITVLNLLGKVDKPGLSFGAYSVTKIEDAELAAEGLRAEWQLGTEPILNVTEMIENKSIGVFDIRASENFDGVSAKVYDEDGTLKIVALVTRNNVDGVRQRLNLAHELGHIATVIDGNVDEEAAAFRFGTAFLAPSSRIYDEVGQKRKAIRLDELLLLKKRFGLSVQALLHRLYELEVITESYYCEWRSILNKMGWKIHEPEDWPFEKSDWMKRQVLRLLAEGIIDKNEAERLMDQKLEVQEPDSLVKRKEFIKLPVDKRRELLAEQALSMAKHYVEALPKQEIIGGGEVIDY